MISGGAGGGFSLLQIKEEDKFCARLLSRETSLANSSSFRVYYGVAAAGSVPFLWESRPGMPKHTSAAAVLPPLTPPPRYYFSSPRSRSRTRSPKKPAGSKSSFLSLPRFLSLKKSTVGGPAPSMSPSSSLSQSFSSSLSSSSSYSPRSDHHRRPPDEVEFSGGGSLASTLCFGMRIFLVKKNALVQSTG